MKKILLFMIGAFGLLSPVMVGAQAFTVQADTVWATVNGSASVFDTITNLTASSINLTWKVTASNFPLDWYNDSALGICDANICRENGATNSLWNGSPAAATSYTCAYSSTTHTFDLSLDFNGATTYGTYYLTVTATDPLVQDTTMTFVITRVSSAAAVTNVNNIENDIVLYPNPARDELNIVYGANADVKNIVVYNIIGKVMMVYKVVGGSANLNLENVPSGIYFVRLTNSHGEAVTTRKFTKQ